MLLAFVSCSYALSAKEYHVSAVKGSDTNMGSETSPFKTISKAAQIAIEGDVITVHGGVYREWVNPPRGGKSDTERIIYRAASGEKVELKGSEVVNSWVNVEGGLWKLELPNSFFGSYNSFKDLVTGDWFDGLGRIHHTGDVYLNGKSLYEMENLDKVKNPMPRERGLDKDGERYAWYTESDNDKTTIWANFQKFNPTKELVEISVRPTCFYPSEQGINYITLSGFDVSQAASQWGAPTAEQIGMIATHWNKGWVIENNKIHDTKCSGITLGKERSTGHNVWMNDQSKDGSLHYIEVTFNTLKHGWSKENIGSHIVRNNVIYNCEQTGMCGSQGAAFSEVYNNHIYNIWVKRQFNGAEIGGIKFHAAIDTKIAHNRIHNAGRAIWLDWMTQGTRVSSNLLYNNDLEDLFLEVDHGPYVVDNNIMLSPVSLSLQSEGGAFVNNLFCGFSIIRDEFGRYTPYHFPHSTDVMGLSIILSGDDRFINNIFVGASVDSLVNKNRAYGTIAYDKSRQKLTMEDNVYYWGAMPTKYDTQNRINKEFNPEIKIVENGESVSLMINIDDVKNIENCSVVTSERLGKTILTKLPFEQACGKPYLFDRDISGIQRTSIIAGPFNSLKSGLQEIKVW